MARSVLSAKGMQSTTRVHEGIAPVIRQEASLGFHDSVAFHPTNGVVHPHAAGGHATSGGLLRRGVLRWDKGAARSGTSRAAPLLRQATAGWPGSACQALRRGLPCTPVAPEAHLTGLVAHEAVVARVACLLATVRRVRLFQVLRALEGSCGPIMHTRDAGAEAAIGSVVSLMATSSAVRAGSRSWSAKACFNTGGSRCLQVVAGD